MNRELDRRLAAAERRLMPPQTEPQVIIVYGGLFGGDPRFAAAGDLRWERAPAESLADFKMRAIAATAAAEKHFVIIGGLPDVDSQHSEQEGK